MSTMNNDAVIEAAGGLVWRAIGDERKIAVVHRTSRHGDEWILPKGKFDRDKGDKSLVDTARREVFEETGCEKEKLRLANFAGSIGYSAGDKPKTVLFWNMILEGECNFKESKEIKELKWLPVNDAVNLLSYPKEKTLLKENIFSEDFLGGRKPATLWKFMNIFKSTSHKRLDDEIPVFESDLKTMIESRLKKGQAISPWAEN